MTFAEWNFHSEFVIVIWNTSLSAIDGQPIDFTRDLSAHLPRKTKKKIGVGVHLNYPPTFGLKG
ncbi:hypothetical protein, partial [Gordonia aichiensis]